MTLSDKSSYKKNSDKSLEFEGIWKRDDRPARVAEQAEKLYEEKASLGLQYKKVKPWGIRSIVLNLIILLIVQVVLSLAFVAMISNGTSNPDNALTELVSNPWVLLLSSLSMYAVWVGGMAITTYLKGKKSFKEDFWVSFRWYDAFIGLGVAVVLFGLVFLSSWFFEDVIGLNMEGAGNGSVFLSLEGAWIFIIGIGIASFLGPLCEELFFRGYVMQAIAKSADTRLRKVESETDEGFGLRSAKFFFKYRYHFAAVVSSILFGFMHFQGTETFGQWYVVLVTGTLGLMFALITLKLKRLGPAIYGHMLYNGGTLLIAMLTMS